MAMEHMGKKMGMKEPMGRHESGKSDKHSEAGHKDLRGLKEFKGVCMGDKHPKGKTKG